MLTDTKLFALERALREERVLSVYLDGTVEDPAAQRTWRVQLDHALDAIRAQLASAPRREREAFEACVSHLAAELGPATRPVGASGWAAFVTPTEVRHAALLPIRTPTSATWGTGICVAPYVFALEQARPVVVLLADARKASLYRYADGVLRRLTTFRAHASVKPVLHMGDAPQVGFHTGVHGAAGRDRAQRTLHEGTLRMLRTAATRATRAAGPEGVILVGGVPNAGRQAAQLVSRTARGRVSWLESLDVHASPAEIAEAVRHGAATLRNASTRRRIDAIMERATEHGLVAVGPAAVQQALGHAQVHELYLTPHYREMHAEDAEAVVRAALHQGARVAAVADEAAARLDQNGGVAAQLRYPLFGASSGRVPLPS